MANWMVDIDSAHSVAQSPDDLERFAAAIDEIRGETGAAASLNSARGSIAASYSVQSDDAVTAATEAVAVFRGALRSAGLADYSPTKLTVEQVPVGAAFWIPDDFDAPMPEFEELFYNSKVFPD